MFNEALTSSSVSLLPVQKIHGKMSNIEQMSSFLRGFKHPMNMALSSALSSKNNNIVLSKEAKDDLKVWSNHLLDGWHSIDSMHTYLPLQYIRFASDAASCADGWDGSNSLGCGGVSFNEDGKLFYCDKFEWENSTISMCKDSSGKRLGSKTTTLEFLGVLLPFLKMTKELQGRYIVVSKDNMGCFFGWVNRKVANDCLASILVRCLHLIYIKFHCTVHIEHLPRMSNWSAKLVDRLSRKSTRTENDEKLVSKFSRGFFPKTMAEWVKCPHEDWKLPNRVILEL